MAPVDPIRSTIVHAFAATTPEPPPAPKPPRDSAPEIEVAEPALERLSKEPASVGSTDIARTFASVPPPPAAALPEVGDVVGEHYILVSKLGEGTFGRVYVAQRIDVPEHTVALKILPRSLYVGRNVDRELVMLATVGHPHVVQLKDHGMTDEYVWLTMPVYEGETLHERLQRGTLPLREAYDVFRTVAYGLEALHDAGLRHQDIKPENIYLAVFGRRIHPVLLDLGVAAEKDASFIAGTALYAAPEQIFALDANPSKAPLTEKMDTYGFATTLLMSLVGPKHFAGDDATQPAELAVAHATRASEPIAKEALPELQGPPRDKLKEVLQKWLALDPKDRPSMAEVAQQLDVLLEKEREEKRIEERSRERQKASLLRFRIAVGGLLLFALTTGIVVWSQRRTLQLANELRQAQSKGAESFDNLTSCVASHKMAKAEAAECKTARTADQSQFQQSLDALSKKGDGAGAAAEKIRELQNLMTAYGTKLKTCEDTSQIVQGTAKACENETARLQSIVEKDKTELATAREEQKKAVESRDKELLALKGERDLCNNERATCMEQKTQCVEQKAQMLVTLTSRGSSGGGSSAGSGASAPAAGTGAPAAPPAPAPTPAAHAPPLP